MLYWFQITTATTSSEHIYTMPVVSWMLFKEYRNVAELLQSLLVE